MDPGQGRICWNLEKVERERGIEVPGKCCDIYSNSFNVFILIFSIASSCLFANRFNSTNL